MREWTSRTTGVNYTPVVIVFVIDVKNINLQIKNIRNMFFYFYKKTLKTWIKALNYTIHSSKKHVQAPSIRIK